MTNEEAQKREDMLLDMYKISAYIPNDAQGNPLTPFGNFCAGYEAHAELAEKENELLQEQLKHCDGVDCTCFAYSQSECACDADWTPKEVIQLKLEKEQQSAEIAQLKADNNRLREALEFWSGIIDYQYTGNSEAMSFIQNADDLTQQVLTKTPAQSLQEHDNELIEKCAKVCESLKEQDYCVDVRNGAEAIRALKGK